MAVRIWLRRVRSKFVNKPNEVQGRRLKWIAINRISSFRTYLWYDEKGKKNRCPAPQYIDYVMTYTQRTISDESYFPTKYANQFPSGFESHVRKMLRLLFHVIAHMYAAHFREIVLIGLHPHLNTTYALLVALQKWVATGNSVKSTTKAHFYLVDALTWLSPKKWRFCRTSRQPFTWPTTLQLQRPHRHHHQQRHRRRAWPAIIIQRQVLVLIVI